MRIVFLAVILSIISIFCNAQEMLTLEQCRQLAIDNNKNLKISEAKINMAQQERNAARTKYFPQISAMGAYMHNQKDLELVDYGKFSSLSTMMSGIASSLTPLFQQMPQLAQTAQIMQQAMPGMIQQVKDATHIDLSNIWIGDISLIQPIFMGGKIITYNQITKYATELAKSQNDTKLADIIYETDEAYWQIVSLANKKKLADKYVELLRKMDSDITSMIKEGVATEADGLSVKVKLNEAEMTQTKVDNGLALSRMLLAQICGLDLNTSITLADESIDDLNIETHSVLPDIETAFANRSEIKSLELATKIYEKKEKIVLADMLPNVALMANYLVTNPNAYNGLKKDFAGAYNIGITLQVPLSAWWEGTYKRNSARAETLIKKLELDDAREKIELQVRQSAYKVNEAAKQLTASQRNMQSAEENLRHADLGFKEGVIPALNLMEAQTAWVSARSQLIDSQIEVKLTEVYMNKALGKLDLSPIEGFAETRKINGK